ncbi:MAG: hypothetical protein ACOY3P_16255 [Planctomycetota bacterium]
MSRAAPSHPSAWSASAGGLLPWRAVVLAALASVSLVMVFRRLGGALVQPLPAAAILGIVALAALSAALLRAASSARRRNPLPAQAVLLAGAPTAALVMLLAAIVVPGTSLGAVLAALALVAVEEGFSWWWWARRPHGAAQSEAGAVPTNTPPESALEKISPTRDLLPDGLSTGVSVLPATDPGGRRVATDDEPPNHSSENVLQRFTRSLDEEGREQLNGWLRVDVQAGQRSGVCHLAFCPPFESTPQVSVEQSEGPEARWRVTQALPHGARLEWRLVAGAHADEPLAVEFWAGLPADAE